MAGTWTLLAAEGPTRCGHAAVVVAPSGQLVIFGGWTGAVLTNDVWAYSFGAACRLDAGGCEGLG